VGGSKIGWLCRWVGKARTAEAQRSTRPPSLSRRYRCGPRPVRIRRDLLSPTRLVAPAACPSRSSRRQAPATAETFEFGGQLLGRKGGPAPSHATDGSRDIVTGAVTGNGSGPAQCPGPRTRILNQLYACVLRMPWQRRLLLLHGGGEARHGACVSPLILSLLYERAR
jgi:hypothetical protein